MTDIRRQLGQQIKTLRKRAGFTQQQFAEAADIDYKYLQRIEGKTPPNIGIELIAKIAHALKTTPAKLLTFK